MPGPFAMSLNHTSLDDSRRPVLRRLPSWAPAAYRLAVRVLGGEEGAEDVVQEACLRAIREVREDATPGEQRTWFLLVTADAARMRLRAEGRRRKREAVVRKHTRAQADGELLGALRLGMSALDEKYRVPLSLCYEEGLSRREAAVVLKMPESTVSKYVNAGLAKLRKALERAGYPAAVAAVLGGLKSTAPAVPASLVERVEALVSSGARAAPRKLASRAARRRSAVQGGYTMKILAGIVLAGAVAAGVAVVSGSGGSEPLPAEAPAGVEVPPDQKYTLRAVATSDLWKELDGPAGMGAESTDNTKGHDIDDASNIYWTQSQYARIRIYREKTDRVETFAGSVKGLMDGPLSRARFGGWAYNSANLMTVSKDGKHVFVLDRFAGGVWRHIDVEAGMVRTLGCYDGTLSSPGHFIIVRDKLGEIYAFHTEGKDVPDCPGYKKLKVAPFKVPFKGKTHAWIGNFSKCALDVEKMRFYWHSRFAPKMCDLTMGKVTQLTSTLPKDKWRPPDTAGSFDAMHWHCPIGIGISRGGRYLYVGGGDSSSFYRLDLEKKYIHIFAYDGEIKGRRLSWPLKDGTFSFQDGSERDKKCRLARWPAAGAFNNHGHGAWITAWGPVYTLTPVE